MAGLAESLPIEERTVQAALAPQRLNFPGVSTGPTTFVVKIVDPVISEPVAPGAQRLPPAQRTLPSLLEL